jgi:hypothetical protein
MHPVNDGMTDVGLQFFGEIAKYPHLNNGHEASTFQKPALAGNNSERTIEFV